jgi:hypothetical protein
LTLLETYVPHAHEWGKSTRPWPHGLPSRLGLPRTAF